MKARPVASFFSALHAAPTASESLTIDVSPLPGIDEPLYEPHNLQPQSEVHEPTDIASFELREKIVPPSPGRLGFAGPALAIGYDDPQPTSDVAETNAEPPEAQPTLNSLGGLKPLGQLRDSFILATNEEGPLDCRPARRP